MIWLCCNTEPCNCAFVFLFVGLYLCICNKVYYEQNFIRFFGIFHLHALASLLTWMRHVLIKRLFSYLFFFIIFLFVLLFVFLSQESNRRWRSRSAAVTDRLTAAALLGEDRPRPACCLAAEASNSQTRLNQLLQPPLSKNVTLGCLEFRPQPD